MIKLLSGLLVLDEGEMSVLGYNPGKSQQRMCKKLGVVMSNDRSLYLRLAVRENLKFFGMLFGLKGRVLEEKVKDVLKSVDL